VFRSVSSGTTRVTLYHSEHLGTKHHFALGARPTGMLEYVRIKDKKGTYRLFLFTG